MAEVNLLPVLVVLSAAAGAGPDDASVNQTGNDWWDGAASDVTGNQTSVDWWSGVVEEDAIKTLQLDGEGGLWQSAFVPPPPRPAFLDDQATPDGVTTCDLCTWAWQNGPLLAIEDTEGSEELGWVLTLVVVALLSAVVGAIFMVAFIQCRNGMKGFGNGGLLSVCVRENARPEESSTTPGDKAGVTAVSRPRNRVWTWLRRPSPAQLGSHTPTPAENHYTVEEAYTSVEDGEEALYAELDRRDDPAYQNTAYNGSDTEQDPDASSPSSAYYSDLSTEHGDATRALATLSGWDTDRTYEAVGSWETEGLDMEQANTVKAMLRRYGNNQARLSAINEHPPITVPSDYV